MGVTRGDVLPAVGVGGVLVLRPFLNLTTGGILGSAGGPATLALLLVTGGVVTAALVVRRRWPLAVLVVVTVACLLWGRSEYSGPDTIVPVAFALGSATLYLTLPRALVVGAATLVTTLLVDEVLRAEGRASGTAATSLLLLALGASIGIAVRNRRRAAAEQAARVAGEVTMAEGAVRRDLAEQRMGLARDLHDTLAHSLAIVSVQSAAAERLVARDPERAAESLRLVRGAAADALGELSGALELLRGGAPAPTSPVQPPGQDVTHLLTAARAAGLEVSADVATLDAAPPVARAAAVRIVQEALTNAQRHAPGARVNVTAAATHDGATHVRVVNGPAAYPAPPSPGAGRGILGMRERALALGGDLSAGPTPEGGFAVEAHLPAPARHPEARES